MTSLALTEGDAQSHISLHCTAWLLLKMLLHNANSVGISFHCIACLLLTMSLYNADAITASFNNAEGLPSDFYIAFNPAKARNRSKISNETIV